MSIWGKVIGGVTGFALGGPVGAILGTVAGHAVDKIRAQEAADGTIEGGPGGFKEGLENAKRQAAFTTAIIVLAAKMAKADGQVTVDEVAAFKAIFQIPPNEMKIVGRIFDEAKKDATGFEPYAEQIADLFRHQPAVMEELIGALFHIAMADGIFHPGEEAFLKRVTLIFGFTEHEYERLKAIHLQGHGGEKEADPYAILDVAHDATDAEVKSTYRKLVRENHPDKLMAEGLPQEFIDLANEKLATINAAYDRIQKQRGFT